MEGEDWIRYNVLVHLYEKKKDDLLVMQAYQAMLEDPLILSLFDDIQDWESVVLKRHNDANHLIHKLSFLAEIGISLEEPAIQTCLGKILAHKSEEGPFQTLSNYPTRFGGTGIDDWLWVLCDAPLIVYCLSKFGLKNDPEVTAALSYLSSLVRENGWPCAACSPLGNFRGPGKASDPCPYANLLMLKAIATMPEAVLDSHYQYGIDTLFNLWENSYDLRPFLFKMGTNFRKLKVPFVWYDILHVLEILSHFQSTHNDARFISMLDVVMEKANENFQFKSESVWTKWKGWEFCQKKEVSRWVTFMVLRILKRSGYAQITLPSV